MSVPTIQTSVNAGELAPSLFGRVDLDKYRKGASTLRNFFASYRGGATSRAGTRYVGQCKQAASVDSTPPVLIPFQFNAEQGILLEAGDEYIRFVIAGAYVTEDAKNIVSISKANPGVIEITGHGWSTGQWVYLAIPTGMTELNTRIVQITVLSVDTFSIQSTLDAANINTTDYTTYVSGGTAARIYTLSTPYDISDVAALKWAQSADVMSFTHPDYPPYDLSRIANNNWTLTKTTFSSGISAPSTLSVTASSSGAFYYQYVATAVDQETGQESVGSPKGTTTSVDIGAQAGSLTVNCGAVTGAGSYNFYRGPITYNTPPTGGALFGFVGTSFGPSFTDSNTIPDYTITPPLFENPFATASITAINISNGGTGYSATTASVAVSSSTGTGFAGTPVVSGGVIQWVVVDNGGEGYSSSDTVTFGGGGTGASASVSVGASTGTYPSVVAYFQQRRFYANSLNNPDTYWASQPGSFTNYDSSNPVQDDDALTGSPWAQQVNGIQWMINMPGGLVVLTALGAWQLSGGGSAGSPVAITPDNQIANPQAYNGVNPLMRPIVINFDILYVQAKGSVVRDLSYNFFVNIYTGTDMTVLSNHLFDGYTLVRWDWAEEPYKLLWAVRNDGILLCLTFLKEQDVYAWSRHDTNGLFQSVACITEPPVDATYVIVKRLIQNTGTPVYSYFLERFDDRLWETIDDAWCADAALAYPTNTPSANLTCNSATGVPTLQQPDLMLGGSGYDAATIAYIQDPTGSGATVSLTINAGVITAISFGGTLTGYTNPVLTITDPTGMGTGAIVNVSVVYAATVTASPGVFSNTGGDGAAGDIIFLGNGLLEVSAYGSSTSLSVNVLRPITRTFPNDPLKTVVPAPAGEWEIVEPVTVVSGLWHLEGMEVACLADGVVIEDLTVEDGSITLSVAAASIVVGLGFTCQLQTMYLEIPAPATIQGRRKTLYNASVRVEASAYPFDVGSNQPDASVQPGGENVDWENLTPFVAEQTPQQARRTPLQPFGLYTGDIYGNINDQVGDTRGQIAIQQDRPLPLTVLAIMPWATVADEASER